MNSGDTTQLVAFGTIDVSTAGFGFANDFFTGASVRRLTTTDLRGYNAGDWEQWGVSGSAITTTGLTNTDLDTFSYGSFGNGLTALGGQFYLHGVNASSDDTNEAPAQSVFNFDFEMIDNDGDISDCDGMGVGFQRYGGEYEWHSVNEGYLYHRNDGLVRLWCSAMPPIGVATMEYWESKKAFVDGRS